MKWLISIISINYLWLRDKNLQEWRHNDRAISIPFLAKIQFYKARWYNLPKNYRIRERCFCHNSLEWFLTAFPFFLRWFHSIGERGWPPTDTWCFAHRNTADSDILESWSRFLIITKNKSTFAIFNNRSFKLWIIRKYDLLKANP